MPGVGGRTWRRRRFRGRIPGRGRVGRMTIVDGDCVGITNINRQIAALNSTVGMPKADVMAARIKRYKPGNRFADGLPLSMPGHVVMWFFRDDYYVVDCIDSISPKLALIYSCLEKGVPLVSAMVGGRMDPSAVRVADISKSKNSPFGKKYPAKGSRLDATRAGSTWYFENWPTSRAWR